MAGDLGRFGVREGFFGGLFAAKQRHGLICEPNDATLFI
ncbi:hypothetical protein TR2A62_2854 [Thalassobium sp. R2A62]|nr:hypothetical protein TR2A62_2854 [Thalassobium sp. R2A62]